MLNIYFKILETKKKKKQKRHWKQNKTLKGRKEIIKVRIEFVEMENKITV